VTYSIEYRAKIIGKGGVQPFSGRHFDTLDAARAAARESFPNWARNAAIFAKIPGNIPGSFRQSRVIAYVTI
jgi:hypothetical protein